MKVLECVPNFSEGRDPKIIQAIADAVTSVGGVRLLSVDPGVATNRTVYTFAGPAAAVTTAACRAVEVGAALIDMQKQKGEHPRNGACDVCPFVPLGEASMEDAVAAARQVGRWMEETLGLSGFYYGEAASTPERRELSYLREGEYEALPAKLDQPSWRPDFGPATFNPRFGTAQVGARDFLVAFNINLSTRSVKIAKDIALEIRERGRFLRDDQGNRLPDGQGGFLRKPGLFRACKATGWYIDEYGRAQVTMNITDINEAPLHEIFDTVVNLAQDRGIRVTGSEIIGLIPLAVLRQAGVHYLRREGTCAAAPERELLLAAARYLGLSELAPFRPEERVVEYLLAAPAPLAKLPVEGFLELLSSDSPAPGGGSVAALCAALSAALSAMVASLGFAKKGFEAKRELLERLGLRAQELKQRALFIVDEDTRAFTAVMAAMKLPKKTEEEKAARTTAMSLASTRAMQVPLELLALCPEAAELARVAAAEGNPNSISDAGMAGCCIRAAARGAWYNVLINLKSVEAGSAGGVREQADGCLAATERTCRAVEELLELALSTQS